MKRVVPLLRRSPSSRAIACPWRAQYPVDVPIGSFVVVKEWRQPHP